MTEWWAIWIPWHREFLTVGDDVVRYQEDKARAKVEWLNQNSARGSHRYKAVPWNEQAQRIHEKGA
jgi:hypothetical protein